MDNALGSDKAYKDWLKNLKIRIRQSQAKATVQVNSTMLELYWSIGLDIVSKQQANGWGSAVIPQLSRDLREEFSDVQGFSARNLGYMRQCYLFYSEQSEFLHQAGAKLGLPATFSISPQIADGHADSNPVFPSVLAAVPWRHHVEIITHAKSIDEALFYIREAIEGGWSRAILVRNMSSDLYSRQGKAPNNFTRLLPPLQSELAQETIKDPYNLDFITLTNDYREKELEGALVENITRFLLELGQGFAFVGKQVPITVGSKELAIDLLFYHLELRCYIVIELKTAAFDAAFMGQLGVYVVAIDEQRKKDADNPTIGLLICKTKDNVYAEYSLKSSSQPIGISSYELTELIPDDYKPSLPTIEEIESELSNRE